MQSKKPAAAAPKKSMSADEKAEIAKFDAWVRLESGEREMGGGEEREALFLLSLSPPLSLPHGERESERERERVLPSSPHPFEANCICLESNQLNLTYARFKLIEAILSIKLIEAL
jgi:hypothetical protein